MIAFIEQYGSLPPPPPASVLEDPLVTGTSRDPLLPLGVFLFELTLFFLFFKAALAKYSLLPIAFFTTSFFIVYALFDFPPLLSPLPCLSLQHHYSSFE